MTTATLTSKGQTTVPKDIRDHLHLRPGDRIEFVIEPDGRVVLVSASFDAADLAGALPRPKRPVSLDEMKAAIRKRGGQR
ncbi:MAG TPA: type II toxin-antitoxin system PrlF family antitoxin [Burkholderiales bacterium]|jgi:AbrB family looped-hinge helix DNA binding protein|nr:type II toxin-antitoxin system PrlF family antitoxin [Burkholderiales bacterium]